MHVGALNIAPNFFRTAGIMQLRMCRNSLRDPIHNAFFVDSKHDPQNNAKKYRQDRQQQTKTDISQLLFIPIFPY